MRSVVLGVLAAGLMATAAAAAQMTVEQARHELGVLADRAGKLPAKQLTVRVEAVIAGPAFAQLTAREQCGAYMLAGAVRFDLQDFAVAADDMAKATRCEGVDKAIWNLRLDADSRVGDWDGAAASLLQLALHWPAEVHEFKDDYVIRVARRAAQLEDGKRRQFELLDALNDAGWAPTDPAETADGLWLLLATQLVEAGHTTRAAAVAQKVSSPWLLADMRADKRFDALFDHAAARYDPEAQSVVDLEHRRQVAVDHPDVLGDLVDYADDLILHHQPGQALKLLDDALAKVAAAPKGKPAYSDLDMKLVWAKDYRSRALLELGRLDDALAMRITASQDKEEGSDNVSQVINLASFYVDLGRPQDGLRVMERLPLRTTSPIGRMIAERVKAEAYAQLGDKAAMGRSLDYMKAHDADGPGLLGEALLATGDVDAVAAMLIRRLDDPDKRLDALSELQDFSPPLHPLPGPVRTRPFHRALVDRPDVKAAIAKVGRINSYSFMGSD